MTPHQTLFGCNYCTVDRKFVRWASAVDDGTVQNRLQPYKAGSVVEAGECQLGPGTRKEDSLRYPLSHKATSLRPSLLK